MENTGQVLFQNDQPQWYIALGEKWVGPLLAADVYQQVLNQQITWAHYVWKPGEKEWKRICDTPTFQVVVPQLPTAQKDHPKKTTTTEVKQASASSPTIKKAAPRRAAPPPPFEELLQEQKTWFLYYNNSQSGPFSTDEIGRSLATGKIAPQVHAWTEGMANWQRIEQIAELKSLVKAAGAPPAPKTAAAKAAAKENRKTPRAPMVAKIFLAHEDAVMVGVCRDVSVGGMQILTDTIPGKVGAKIKLNVSPPSAGKKAKGTKAHKEFEPFVAEGVIVRILEDGRGFSFRFDRLPEGSRRSIQEYLK
jgi:hypothetical protein